MLWDLDIKLRSSGLAVVQFAAELSSWCRTIIQLMNKNGFKANDISRNKIPFNL